MKSLIFYCLLIITVLIAINYFKPIINYHLSNAKSIHYELIEALNHKP